MKTICTVAILLCLVAAGALAAGRNWTVSIRGGGFSPASITISAGDSVTWINSDDRDHCIGGDSFRSDNLGRGQSYEHTFVRAGTYSYSCSYHPRERGLVVVRD